RLAHLQSSNILTTKMKSPLAELNMRYFNSANGYNIFCKPKINERPSVPEPALPGCTLPQT
ncbi:hypothetical protein, partial [Prevotella heparinolytica]|uniref:hypothetical protein n=1 Tax=Prevotella heparinolytica TaxID=28113 RepID=UPI001BE11641